MIAAKRRRQGRDGGQSTAMQDSPTPAANATRCRTGGQLMHCESPALVRSEKWAPQHALLSRTHSMRTTPTWAFRAFNRVHGITNMQVRSVHRVRPVTPFAELLRTA